MFWLILGVLIWSGVHLIPSVARPLRSSLIERLGEQKYPGLFAMSILISLGLIIFGWRSTPPVPIYAVSSWGRIAALLLVYPALVLFIASALPTNIKRVLRHPQLIPELFTVHGFGPSRPVTGASPWPWIDHLSSGLIRTT